MKTLLSKTLLWGMLLGLVGFTACSDDFGNTHTGVQQGDVVKFAASSPTTRTVYDDNNIFQINWEAGDKIKIFTDKAHQSISNADYSVTPNATTKKDGSINAVDGTRELMWADNSTHRFVGVYPHSADVTVEGDVVTLPINRNQICEAVTVQGTSYATKYGNYTYYAKPDMKNAYLVAYNELTPQEAANNANGQVFLNFKPVMTAIEIVVKGREDVNQAPVQVTGVSVRRELPTPNSGQVFDSFKWNAKTNKLAYGSLAGTVATERKVENTLVSLQKAVVLNGRESIVFTVFLPPLDVNTNTPIQIRVHATGDAEVVSQKITNEILASTKRRVTLKYFKPTTSTTTGNNWITPLDDDIYVSQLSIPGTHDAATGEGMVSSVGNIAALTQNKTLSEQWDLGVRCFDLRPAIYKGTFLNQIRTLHIYHGVTRTNISWDAALNVFREKMKEHPGEFAIVVFRHEDERTASKDHNPTTFNNMMRDYISSNRNDFVFWKPDLTIGECRGKIILISRFTGSWIYGAFTEWNHNEIVNAPQSQLIKDATGSKTADIYIQDYYDFPSHAKKEQSIKNMLDYVVNFHTDPNHVNSWVINHVSGYVSPTSTASYRDNAAYQNPIITNYLKNRIGTTGMMLFDYAGVNTFQNVSVQGDIMLQTVIDNNYKYRMKRKGE